MVSSEDNSATRTSGTLDLSSELGNILSASANQGFGEINELE